MFGGIKRALPSPALVVACTALIVSLSGTAVAAGIVANARHANNADVAKRALTSDKLQGKTATEIATAGAQAAAQLPGPASTVAGLITVKSAPWSFGPNGQGDVTATCDAGQKAVAGGWDDPNGWGHPWDTRPTPDGSGWQIFVTVSQNAPGPQSGSVYAICIK
jgi:hypothetical protein